MANWLLTVNYDQFDLASAYDALSVIYWKNDVETYDAGLQLNDIVYIYVTGKTAKVMYQMRVTTAQVNNTEYPIAQKDFWIDKAQIEQYKGKFSILKKISRVDKTSLSYMTLLQKKLIPDAVIQGRTSDKSKGKKPEKVEAHKKLFEYIQEQFISEIVETDYPDEANVESKTFPEGAKQTVQVNRYERSPEARAKCIEIYGTRCYVCTMSFEHTYGQFAKDFIHVHHINFLGVIKEEHEVDPEKDLRPVCPNCHAMLHRQENGLPMEIERLKTLFETYLNEPKRYDF